MSSKLKFDKYDYGRVTTRVEERLFAYMKLAASAPAGSPSRDAYHGTARNIYSSWRSFAVEAGQLDPDDDVKFQAILRQWL